MSCVRDKNVIAPRSERIRFDQNASEGSVLICRTLPTDQNTLGDLQNRRAGSLGVAGGVDSQLASVGLAVLVKSP